MSCQFGRVDLAATSYCVSMDWRLLNPVPMDEVMQVYHEYCHYRHFQSVIPIIPGRFSIPGTEVIGYHEQDKLIAWSMYRIWDQENIVIDQHAWDYSKPEQKIGLRSLHNECALYRGRGFRWMYFESVEPYMLDIEGFEILGEIT